MYRNLKLVKKINSKNHGYKRYRVAFYENSRTSTYVRPKASQHSKCFRFLDL